MKIEITTVTLSGLHDLVDFARSTFYETWKSVNTHEDLMSYLDEAFDLKKVESELSDTVLFTFLVLSVDSRMAGYAKLNRATPFEGLEQERVVEVEKFYFDRVFHGKGLADLLMKEILQRASEEGADWLCLGVDVNNHRAIRFYTRYGFTVFGRKEFRVGSQVDTDQLMKRSLR